MEQVATNITSLIKQIARDDRIASKPADIIIGTVVKSSPLSIKVSGKATLTSTFLWMCESGPSLSKGDKVALIRAQGGQRYLVIDKVV